MLRRLDQEDEVMSDSEIYFEKPGGHTSTLNISLEVKAWELTLTSSAVSGGDSGKKINATG